MKPPAEFSGYFNMFVYGESGVGKTTLIGTAQDHEDTAPLLIIDIEGGMTTLRKKTNIDVVQARSIKEVIEIFNKLHMDTSGYYKTVGLDSLTELQALDLREILNAAHKAKPDKVDPDKPQQQHWGISREHMRKIVRAFKDLPVNFITTASLVTERDEDEPTRYYPALPGKLRGDVPGFMDVVGFMRAKHKVSTDEVIRTLQVGKTERVIAKDRFDILGSLIESPSIPLIFEKIKES